MDIEFLARQVMGCFTSADLELLLNLNFRRAYERGEVMVSAGETVDRFYLVEEGLVRLDESPPVGPRFLRPGQVFGSTSVLQTRVSPHSVIAEDSVTAITLSASDLDWLVEAEPASAARLVRALATALAWRNLKTPVGAGAVPASEVRLEEPSGLALLYEACREVQKALNAMGPAPDEGQAFWARERIPAVATAYRPVLRALASLLDNADPLDRERLVGLARRELRAVTSGSKLVDRFRSRPTGRAAGWRGFNHIYRNVPEGDDTVGLLTDAWLLTRPFAEAVRERRTIASERTVREVLDRARPDRMVRILSLGCGPARSLGDLLEEPDMAEKISITIVDDDNEALVHANNLLKGRAPRADITYKQTSPSDLTPEAEGFGGYDIVASLYTGDGADAAALGRVLYTSHRWMHAHGVLTLVVFGDAVPDWLLLEVLLEWKPLRYTQRELQDILSRSPFKQSHSEVAPTPSGLNVFLRATK